MPVQFSPLESFITRFTPAQELPVSSTRASEEVWQGPAIAMVLPPPAPYNPSHGPDLTLQQQDTSKSTRASTASPGLHPSMSHDDGIAARRLTPSSSNGSRSPSREPQFELVTKESMNAIRNAQASGPTRAGLIGISLSDTSRDSSPVQATPDNAGTFHA
jgi:hypothetical protein